MLREPAPAWLIETNPLINSSHGKPLTRAVFRRVNHLTNNSSRISSRIDQCNGRRESNSSNSSRRSVLPINRRGDHRACCCCCIIVAPSSDKWVRKTGRRPHEKNTNDSAKRRVGQTASSLILCESKRMDRIDDDMTRDDEPRQRPVALTIRRHTSATNSRPTRPSRNHDNRSARSRLLGNRSRGTPPSPPLADGKTPNVMTDA